MFSRNSKQNFTLLKIISMALIGMLVFSLLCIGCLSSHSCCGEECPICTCVNMFLHMLKMCFIALAFMFLVSIEKGDSKASMAHVRKAVFLNLVTMGVKLSD